MVSPASSLRHLERGASPLLARILHVRRTELRRTLQVAGFAIVVGWAMYTAFSAAQSVFLTKAGPHAYPLFFIVLALAVWPMDALQGELTRRFGVGRAFRINLGTNAVLAVGVYIAYTVHEDATVAFVAYVIYSVAFELVMLQFWGFVTQHFNVLEGKRVFPVIAAGSSIGYILSGFTATVVAVFATEPLIFIWAIGSIAAAVMSIGLERTLYRPAFIEDADQLLAQHEADRKRHGLLAMLVRSLEHVAGSRLVLALLVLVLVLQVTSRTGDYLVAIIWVAATHSNLQDLTILIGNAWLVSYAVQLAVSLFVAPWVLARLGVKNALLALPVFTLVGFAAVAVAPILATSLFLFIVRNGLQTGLDDPTENVLGGALPAQVVPKLQLLMNNAILPGGALVSGLLLLLVQAAITETAQALAIIGVVIAIGFVAAAWWVRSLYLDAIYARLRTHALSLADFQQAIGRPAADEIAELQQHIRGDSPRLRELAAAALANAAPDAFGAILPELLVSKDAVLRRLAVQLAPAGALSAAHLDVASGDEDPWVRAAAAVASGDHEALAGLRAHDDARARSAAVWAAAALSDHATVVAAMGDVDSAVRLEALRTFARMKGDVDDVDAALIACLTDADIEVRREALRQAVRWAPPAAAFPAYTRALAEGLTSGDREVRELAAEAMAAHTPDSLVDTLPLLLEDGQTATAAVEALVRSGRPELYRHAREHLEKRLASADHLAGLSARITRERSVEYALLRIGLDDYVRRAVEAGLAAMHVLHGKRGFATVERGLSSTDSQTREEALETLLNFGPSWLAGPLARLLDPDSFDPVLARPLSQTDLDALAKHPDRWVREMAQAATAGIDDHMKELIALKQVPLFSALTLEQLASVDRLMVTRHFAKGETVFRRGDVGGELYLVVDGEIRIHLDHDGRQVTLATYHSGGVLGEMSVFDEQPRSASAQAISDATLRVLRRDRLQAIVHEHPEVLLEFIKNLSQRLRAMDEKLETETPPAEAAATP